MKVRTFRELYYEARDYTNLELYIHERGWQDWMEEYLINDDATRIAGILTEIFIISKMDIATILKHYKLSLRQTSNETGIAYRTIQDWALNKRTPPESVHLFFIHALFNDYYLYRDIEQE